MAQPLIFGWYKRFRANRKRRDYRDKLYGSTLPASHLKRPTGRMMLAAAKRFAQDGELRNAVEMLKLAYYPQQLKLYFPDEKKTT